MHRWSYSFCSGPSGKVGGSSASPREPHPESLSLFPFPFHVLGHVQLLFGVNSSCTKNREGAGGKADTYTSVRRDFLSVFLMATSPGLAHSWCSISV